MRLVVNRCDDIFGRISTHCVEVEATTTVFQIRAQLATLLKLREADVVLRTIAVEDREGRELRSEETVGSAGLRENEAVAMEMKPQLEEEAVATSSARETEAEDEESKVPQPKSKSQWLALLIQLCRVGNHKTMIRLLSDYEMEVTSNMIEVDEDELVSKAGPDGWTPLHYACHKGHMQVTQTLCTRKACPNIESNDHWTPLQLAVYHGHVDCKG